MSYLLKTKKQGNHSLSQNHNPDTVSVKQILEENVLYSEKLQESFTPSTTTVASLLLLLEQFCSLFLISMNRTEHSS